MSTTTSVHVYDNGSAANYKNWGKYISDALTAAGWTYGSDSGQILQDWSDNPAVPGTNTYKYQIWKMADSLQGSFPVVVKVEFGNSNGGSNNPSVRITVGTGSNGSGTITGSAIIGPTTCVTDNTTAGTGATTYDCYSSGTTGRIGLLMWRNAATSIPMFFGMERTLDSTGTANSDGVTLLTVGATDNNGYARQQTLTLNPSVALASQYKVGLTLGSCFQTGFSSDTLTTNVAISPVFPDYGKFGNPHSIAGRAGITDVVENTTISTTLYGSGLTYLVTFNGTGFSAFNSIKQSGASAFLMRYD